MLQSSPFNFGRAVILIVRLMLGGIFMYAGYSKIFRPNLILSPWFALKFSITTNLSTFGAQVESYRLLSAAGVSLVAHTLPLAASLLGLRLLMTYRLRIWAALDPLLFQPLLTGVT